MPESEQTTRTHLERWLLDQWAERLRQSLETMTGLLPVVETGPDQHSDQSSSAEMLWWKQPLTVSPGAAIWVGAPEQVWSALGGMVLQAAGIEEPNADDRHGCFIEIVQQALSGLAQAVMGVLRKEVRCEGGAESIQPPEKQVFDCRIQWAGGANFLIHVCFENALTEAILRTQDVSLAGETTAEVTAGSGPQASARELPDTNRTIDLLYDVELPVSISFGRAHLPLKEVLKLTSGSIVELNRAIAEPVEVIVNNCVIARGEVVVVDGNYGVRVTQIVSRRERLRTLH